MRTAIYTETLHPLMLTANIVELTVYDLKSYHFECCCGFKGRGYEKEAAAVRAAKRHHQKEQATA